MENNNSIESQILEINEKIDKILSTQEWIKRKIEDDTFIKRWGGFYLASLIADETLGIHGRNSIFRNT